MLCRGQDAGGIGSPILLAVHEHRLDVAVAVAAAGDAIGVHHRVVGREPVEPVLPSGNHDGHISGRRVRRGENGNEAGAGGAQPRPIVEDGCSVGDPAQNRWREAASHYHAVGGTEVRVAQAFRRV